MNNLIACECESEWQTLWTCSNIYGKVGYFIECDDCLARTAVYETEDAAINAWNGGEYE